VFYLFKYTWKYAAGDRWRLAACYLLHTLSFAGTLLQPYAFGMAVNTLQAGGIDNLDAFARWLGLYIAGFALFQIGHRSARYYEISTSLRNQQRFTDAAYAKLYGLPLAWHTDNHSGVVVNRIKMAGEALRDFGFSQSNFMEHAVLSAGPVLILLGMDFRMTGLSAALLLITLLVAFRLNKTIRGILDQMTESYHLFAGRLADFIGNIRTVITLRLGGQTGGELSSRFVPFFRHSMKENSVNQLRCFILDLGAILAELSAILLYLYSCRRGEAVFMIGNLVMIITYFRQMRDAVFEIASSFYTTMHWASALKSAHRIMDEATVWSSTTSAAMISGRGLTVKHLVFSYPHNPFSLSVEGLELPAGGRIAVVGSSGSGKSTLLYLLSGLFAADGAEVLDGAAPVQLKDVSDAVGLITQDVEIFENTVGYNITFGTSFDPPALHIAVDCAGFREVLDRLPSGFETDVREKGVNLSGGEKQRLALARGLYFSASKSILLLDEVTSSVDAVNERRIMTRIFSEFREKTIICTVHRLHLLDMFDMVLVMRDGRIVQKGTFADLADSEGCFRALWDKYKAKDAPGAEHAS
jgi:ABC-type multidrug transport system fused ATPase/permease subunit